MISDTNAISARFDIPSVCAIKFRDLRLLMATCSSSAVTDNISSASSPAFISQRKVIKGLVIANETRYGFCPLERDRSIDAEGLLEIRICSSLYLSVVK